MADEPEEGMALIPRAFGIGLGINFFEDTIDPIIVMNLILPPDAADDTLIHRMEDRSILPVAITPADLQALVPEIVDAVIKARTIMEMLTTWPEKRDEILSNISFRWTGQMPPESGNGNGS